MSATLTPSQKALIRELLKTGKWRNENEIIRHGLELVRLEVQRQELSPVTLAEAAACYAAMTEEELEADRAMGRASITAQTGTA
jgi:Arc/MetJ-type ribon-helix-helix transcriptional regulator